MKKIIFILSLLAIISSCSFRSKAGPRYESFISEGKQVVFFYPAFLSSSQTKDNIFEYDFTHQQQTDSITLNFSVISPKKASVKSVLIIGNTGQLSPKYQKTLYCDYSKKKYITRVQTSFNYEQFKQLIETSNGLIFKIQLEDGEEEFAYKPKVWRKEQEIMSIIFKLLE